MCFSPLHPNSSSSAMAMAFQKYIFLFALINLYPCVFFIKAQVTYHCYDSGNYTENSAFGTNLASAFLSLNSTIHNNGFIYVTTGTAPDQVYADALCRADLQLNDCRKCITDGTKEILQNCPVQMKAIIWMDYCTIRYSFESFSGQLDKAQASYLIAPWMVNNNSLQQFNHDLSILLADSRNQAVKGGYEMKVGVGNATGPDFMMLYSLLQCTPNISDLDCQQCLDIAIRQIPVCCNVRGGARVLYGSCTLRYETNLFYNITRIHELQFMSISPSPSTSPILDPNSTTTPILHTPIGVSHLSRNVAIVISVVAACVFFIVVLVFFLYGKMIRKRKETNSLDDENEISKEESLQFEFERIKTATDDFSVTNIIGRGGFGTVYKGKLENGQEIAVKRLSKGSSQGHLEFKNEVILMAKLQHRNLVRIFGFAMQGNEKLLVYEFVKNGSLHNFIFDPTKRTLDWVTRFEIIKGIAKGLVYLHEDSRLRIIHRDLKAGNILLDGGMNPKIADFGLARLFACDESAQNTSKVVGTYGYMAPEYLFQGQLSSKTDAFSFGILILEIVSGQKNINDGTTENLLSCMWKKWREGAPETMVDPMLRACSSPSQEIVKCIHIGLLCTQQNPSRRPTMSSIVLMLRSTSITLPVLSTSTFSDSAEINDENALINHQSRNEISISDLSPR